MNLQIIKSSSGKPEYVLLPIAIYNALKSVIQKQLEDEYVEFDAADYIDNPVALIRIKARMTQEELAKHLNVSQAYVSKIENQKKVSIKILQKVKDSLK